MKAEAKAAAKPPPPPKPPPRRVVLPVVLPPLPKMTPRPVKPKPPPPPPPPPNPRRWTYGEAAIVCLSAKSSASCEAEFVWWPSVDEALEADRLLMDTPCRPRCVGRHLIALRDDERVRVHKSVHEPVPSLEQALADCYGPHVERTLSLPPPDPAYNEPVTYVEHVVKEWAADDASVQKASAVATPEMDDADRWLAEHEEMAQ